MRCLAILFNGFIAVGSAWWVGTPLLADVRVALGGAVAAEGWRVDRASCETDWYVVSRCTVAASTAASVTDAVPRRYQATCVLLASHQTPAEMIVVRGASDIAETADISTEFGQQTPVVRSVTFVIYAALLVGVVYVNTGQRSPAQLGLRLGAWLRQSRRPDAPAAAPLSHQRLEDVRAGDRQTTSASFPPRQTPKPTFASRAKSKRPPGWFT